MNMEWLQSIYWREPLWGLLALQPVFLMLLRGIWRKRRLDDYADAHLRAWVIQNRHPSLRQRLFSRDAAYIAAWILFAIAAMGPRLPEEIPKQGFAERSDIMLAVDISRSMRAADVTPDRLRRATLEIRELLERNRSGADGHGDRIGIIVYAAKPHVYVPLTYDMRALEFYLRDFDQLVAPTHGSRAHDALRLAAAQLRDSPRAAVILISDGDFAGQDTQARTQLSQAAEALTGQGVTLHVLGMGSVEGDAVPDGEGGWLMHQGRPVVSRNDEELLSTLARLGGGRYSRVRDDDGDWAELYDAGIRAGSKTRIDKTTAARIVWHELYAWALLPGVLLLWLSTNAWRPRRDSALAAGAGLLVLASLSTQHNAQAAGWPGNAHDDAYQAWQEKAWERAAEAYANIKHYSGRMGEGASRYRQGRYGDARAQFAQAMLLSENDTQRARALYNLGNSYFQLGDYKNAAASFEDALRYRPAYQAAENNLAFSLELNQVIEQRLARTGRMGRGPREARAEDQVEISELGAVSLDDSEDENKDTHDATRLGELDPRQLAELINRGIDHVRLAAGETSSPNSPRGARAHSAGANVEARIQSMEERQALLWQRLFEVEEGFPAPLSKPRQVLGVEPW